ncbi:hypothetical protein, partial [Bacteroides congonensis]
YKQGIFKNKKARNLTKNHSFLVGHTLNKLFSRIKAGGTLNNKETMHALPVSGLNNIENCQINEGRVSYLTDCMRIILV